MGAGDSQRSGVLGVAVLACAVALLAVPTIASAAFPIGTNGRIAFASCGTKCHVDVMNGDGSGRIELTNTPGVDDTSPSFSPDGRLIAFVRADGMQEDVWLMNADGSGQVDLTRTAAPNQDFDPTSRPTAARSPSSGTTAATATSGS